MNPAGNIVVIAAPNRNANHTGWYVVVDRDKAYVFRNLGPFFATGAVRLQHNSSNQPLNRLNPQGRVAPLGAFVWMRLRLCFFRTRKTEIVQRFYTYTKHRKSINLIVLALTVSTNVSSKSVLFLEPFK